MALSKKQQIKSKEASEKILKMRKEVLNEIKRNERVAKLRQNKQNKDELKEVKIKKRFAEKKTPLVVSKEPGSQDKNFEPTSKDILNLPATNLSVLSESKKDEVKNKNTAAKLEDNVPPKPKPCFFSLKSISNEKTDSVEIKSDKINSTTRKQKKPVSYSKAKNIFILFFIGLILGCLLFAFFVFYIPKNENLLARKISKVIPFPAIIINGKFISYNDYLKEVDTVGLFLARQERIGVIRELPPRKQIREEIKDLLIKQEIIRNLANQYKITVSQKEIDNEINKIKEKSRSEESFDVILKDLYGWSEDDFGNKVVRNYLFVSKLSNKIFPDVFNEESKNYLDKKIEEIKKGMNIYVLVK